MSCYDERHSTHPEVQGGNNSGTPGDLKDRMFKRLDGKYTSTPRTPDWN